MSESMSNPIKESRENPILRKLKEGSEQTGLTTAFQSVKQTVGKVTNPIKTVYSSAYSRTSDAWTTLLQWFVGKLQAIMRNPVIDILIGAGTILLFGYILKNIFYSLERSPQTQFLSQSIYAWFVILSILYVASKVL